MIGIGMGSRESMTIEAAEAVRNCDCMIGSQWMLLAARVGRYGTRVKEKMSEQPEPSERE